MKCYVSSSTVYLLSRVTLLQQRQCHRRGVLQIARTKTCTAIAELCGAAGWLKSIVQVDENQMLSLEIQIWDLICAIY